MGARDAGEFKAALEGEKLDLSGSHALIISGEPRHGPGREVTIRSLLHRRTKHASDSANNLIPAASLLRKVFPPGGRDPVVFRLAIVL